MTNDPQSGTRALSRSGGLAARWRTPVWWLAILFGVLSALINMPIVEKPVPRVAAAAA